MLFSLLGRMINLCPALKRRTRSGSRKIDHRQDGTRKDSDGQEKPASAGFLLPMENRRECHSVPATAARGATAQPIASPRQTVVFTYRDDLFDQPLQGSIPFTLRNADDIQPEATEIEGQVKQLER